MVVKRYRNDHAVRLECIVQGGHGKLCLLVGGCEGAGLNKGLAMVCYVHIVLEPLGACNVMRGVWDHLLVAQES